MKQILLVLLILFAMTSAALAQDCYTICADGRVVNNCSQYACDQITANCPGDCSPACAGYPDQIPACRQTDGALKIKDKPVVADAFRKLEFTPIPKKQLAGGQATCYNPCYCYNDFFGNLMCSMGAWVCPGPWPNCGNGVQPGAKKSPEVIATSILPEVRK